MKKGKEGPRKQVSFQVTQKVLLPVGINCGRMRINQHCLHTTQHTVHAL